MKKSIILVYLVSALAGQNLLNQSFDDSNDLHAGW